MKNLIMIIGLSAMLFSCSKDDQVLPQEPTCQLSFYSEQRTAPSEYDQTNAITYHEDSMVMIREYDGSPYDKEVYLFDDSDNLIHMKRIDLGSNMMTGYGTYYLNQQGLIDSFVRYFVNEDSEHVDYRNIITRDGKGRIVREISDYISYGHDRRFFFDENGDYSYGLEKGLGTQTYDDTIIYTMDLTKPDNGSASYPLANLKGKRAAHRVIRKQYIDRSTLDDRRESRWTYGPLDIAGNPTFIRYETQNYPGLIFEADYVYDRNYSYICP